MKIIYYLMLLGTVLTFASCELDNFDEPDAMLSGNLTYNGQVIPVARNQVGFELWQPGYGAPGAINVTVAQDGSYSSRLFSGDYKLIFQGNQGPFQAPKDTIYFTMNGSMEMDIPVTPYYMIGNPQFSQSGGTVSGSCSVNQIITGADAKNVERVVLVINRTLFVDANSGDEGSIASADGDLSDLSNVSMSVDIPVDETKPDQNYIFARIGLKIEGVEDMIYTQVEKITF